MQTPLKHEPLYRQWTFGEEIILLQHWDGTETAKKIAELLNVDVSRVKEKAHRFKLGSSGIYFKWSEEELDYLQIIAETITLEDLVIRFNTRVRKEKNKKWSYRTKKALKRKLVELGYSIKPIVGYITLTELCRYVGRNRRYMQTLIDDGKLEVKRAGENFIYVSEKSFIEFAKKYPYDIGEKMTQEGVIWFLQILGNEE